MSGIDLLSNIDFKEQTDLSETLKELNSDTIDVKTGMTGMDMRTRLSGVEIPAILAIDALVSLDVLPQEMLALTRQKKRLAVSLGGLGRREIVKIATGREDDDKKDFVKTNSLLGSLQRRRSD